MTTFSEELDKLFQHVEFHPSDIDMDEERRNEFKLSLLNLVSERIIGDDDYPAPGYRVLTLSKKHRNEHRDEQRTTLYEGTKNGDNNE